MSDVIEKLSIIQKFLKILTWTKLAQLAIFILLIGIAWGVFENRNIFYRIPSKSGFAAIPTSEIKLSKSTVELLETTLKKSDLIVGIQVTVVDFNHNSRLVIYSGIDDPDLIKVYKNYESSIVGEIPLFNSDPVNNVRMSQLINGEFICNPYSETIANKLAPEGGKFVKTVCANGIPPYYGKFAGIISIYLKKPPTAEEVDQIRFLAKDMSAKIFDKDIK